MCNADKQSSQSVRLVSRACKGERQREKTKECLEICTYQIDRWWGVVRFEMSTHDSHTFIHTRTYRPTYRCDDKLTVYCVSFSHTLWIFFPFSFFFFFIKQWLIDEDFMFWICTEMRFIDYSVRSLGIICCSLSVCGVWARFVSFYLILKMQTSILEMSRVSIHSAALCCSSCLPLISLINTPFVFVCSSTSFSSKFMDIVLLTDFYAEHCPPCVFFYIASPRLFFLSLSLHFCGFLVSFVYICLSNSAHSFATVRYR